MPYINRDIGVNFINSFMKDECRVVRRPMSNEEDVLDPVTLELIPADNDELIYEGKCTIGPFNSKDRNFEVGEWPQIRKGYSVFVPEDSDGIDIGDWLILERAAFNDQLTNIPLRVFAVITGTHRVYYEVWVEDVRPDREPTLP